MHNKSFKEVSENISYFYTMDRKLKKKFILIKNFLSFSINGWIISKTGLDSKLIPAVF